MNRAVVVAVVGILLGARAIAPGVAGAAARHDVDVPAARPAEAGVVEFITDRRIPIGAPMSWLAAGHFDHDRRPDLVMGTPGRGTIGVLLQTNSGEFARRDVAVGGGPGAVAVADVTGDGLDDLALSLAADSSIALLLADGDGGFSVEGRYRVGASPRGLVFADLDGDRLLDLACVSREDSTVRVWRHAGRRRAGARPVFEPWTVERVGEYAEFIVAGDLNGDGTTDLATGGGPFVSVLPNLGDGTFAPRIQSRTEYPAFSLTPTPGDLDGDGDLDLAAGCEGRVFALYNDGRGMMTDGPNVSAAYGYSSHVTLADVDNDGDLEVLHSCHRPPADNGGHTVNRVETINNVAGELRHSHATVTGPAPIGILACDLDGDRFVDVVTLNQGDDGEGGGPPSLSILHNRRTGHFDGIADYGFPEFPTEEKPRVVAPLTRPGRSGPHAVDLLLCSGRGTLVMQGDGSGGFGRPELVLPHQAGVTDLTGDGVSDLFAYMGNGIYRSWLGDREGGFVPGEDFAPGGWWLFVHEGKDRLPDILVYSSAPAILENLGHGRFGPRRELPPSPGLRFPSPMIAEDLDGDGVDELIGVATRDTLVELARTPAGEYQRVRSIPVFADSLDPESIYQSYQAWDIRIHPNLRDGGWDIAVLYKFRGGRTTRLSIVRRCPDGRFERTDYYSYPGGEWSDQVMGDFDGDGLGDVALSMGDITPTNIGDIRILRNLGGGKMAAEPPVRVAAGLGRMVAADVNGDGTLDLLAYAPDWHRAYVFLGRGRQLPEGAGVPPPRATKPDRGDQRAGRMMLTSAEPDGSRGFLSFTMARSGPANLDVFDLAGRRVLERDLGWLAAGEHSVEVPRLEGLAPGIYWLRLGARGAGSARRVVVTK